MSAKNNAALPVVITLLVITVPRPAVAQWTVTDPTLTARNAVIAYLKQELLETLTLQRERLKKMATRPSTLTRLGSPRRAGHSPLAHARC